MLEHSTVGGVTQVRFTPGSKLNIANSSDVKAEFAQIVKSTNGKMRLDLAGLDYIDSSGIGAMLSLLRLCREKKWQLTLANPQQGVKDLFNLLQLQSIFQFE